tara:strand:- start:1846 stop:3084 length:1239 start_codon:yes stop_codon:yes gene_type:complete
LVYYECQNNQKRIIAHIDMNAFFASVEQYDNPKLRNKALLITNGQFGTTVITCSYEARRYGIKTGMSVIEAKQRCPGSITLASRARRYQEIATAIWLRLMEHVTPDLEVASIDEAYLDFSYCRHLYANYKDMIGAIQSCMSELYPLPYSIGISSTKKIAKYAAGFRKPNGITVIPPQHVKKWLAPIKLSELCGVGVQTAKTLAKDGLIYCYQVQALPISVLTRKLGVVGKWIWLCCQGIEFEPIVVKQPEPVSLSHSKVLPPSTYDIEQVWSVFQVLCAKIGQRLRMMQCRATCIFIRVKTAQRHYFERKIQIKDGIQDEYRLFAMLRSQFRWPYGLAIRHVHIGAWELIPANQQSFIQLKHNHNLLAVQDEIEKKYGKGAIRPMRMIKTNLGAFQSITPRWRIESDKNTQT